MENNVKFVQFKYIDDSYQLKEHNDDDLCELGLFLSGEASLKSLVGDFYIDWLRGRYDQEHAYGDAYGLKEYNDRIYVCFIYDPLPQHLTGFNTSREKMFELIGRWRDIACTVWTLQDGRQLSLPDEILITQEGDDVRINPLDPDHPLYNNVSSLDIITV